MIRCGMDYGSPKSPVTTSCTNRATRRCRDCGIDLCPTCAIACRACGKNFCCLCYDEHAKDVGLAKVS